MSDLIYRELMNDMVWSYTRLTCYEDCKYRWYLQYLYHEKETPQFYSSYGSFMHKLLEKYYNNQLTKDKLPTWFLLNFQNEVQGDRPSASIVSKYINQGCNYLKSFDDFPFNKVSTEERMEFKIGEHSFVGYIDYLGEKDGEYYIIDNKSRDLKPKSGKKKPTLKDKELDEMSKQLYLYAAGVKQKYGKFPVALCFNCFRTGMFIKLEFDKQKYDETIQWALDTIEEIKNTSNFTPNRQYFSCKYICGFSDSCCYWQERGSD